MNKMDKNSVTLLIHSGYEFSNVVAVFRFRADADAALARIKAIPQEREKGHVCDKDDYPWLVRRFVIDGRLYEETPHEGFGVMTHELVRGEVPVYGLHEITMPGEKP